MAKNSKEYMREYMKNYRKKEAKKEVNSDDEEIVIKTNNKLKKELKDIFIDEDEDSPTIKDLINKIAYNSSLIDYLNKRLTEEGFTYKTNSGIIKLNPLNTTLSYANSAYMNNMKLLYNITNIEED